MSLQQRSEVKVSCGIALQLKHVVQHLRDHGIPAYMYRGRYVQVERGELWVNHDIAADQLIYRWFTHE